MRRISIVLAATAIALFMTGASASGVPKVRTKSCSVSVPAGTGGTNILCKKVPKCTSEITVTVTGDPGSDGIAQCFDSAGGAPVNAYCMIPALATSCTVTLPVPFSGTYFFCGVGHPFTSTDTPTAVCTATQNA
jgi:hypothetical protein